MATSVYLGMGAKLYVSFQNAAGRLFENIKDVTLNLSSATADVTTRKNSGWRATVRTLKEASLSFQIVLVEESTGSGSGGAVSGDGESDATDIVKSFLADSGSNQLVGVGALDAKDGCGIIGEWSVTSCNRGENLEDAITYDVELSLVKFLSWKERFLDPVSKKSDGSTDATATARAKQIITPQST